MRDEPSAGSGGVALPLALSPAHTAALSPDCSEFKSTPHKWVSGPEATSKLWGNRKEGKDDDGAPSEKQSGMGGGASTPVSGSGLESGEVPGEENGT